MSAPPLVLFPCEPFDPKRIDPDFERERRAARATGFDSALIDHSGVISGKVAASVSRVPEGAGAAMYRGWMLTPSQYEALHEALSARGVELVNDARQYRTAHYLPESYPWLEGHTPRSVWLKVDGAPDAARLAEAAASFGDRPLVVKDYVKSQKHYWHEACFVPAASDLPALERVVRRFLELQGEDLNEGLVLREFVPLKTVGKHPKSGMPLAAELRIFWLAGQAILSHRYWGDLTTFDLPLPWTELGPIAARIPSRFFTMDVAFLEDGSWTIVELGDGQVAGLPDVQLAPDFYEKIAKAFREASLLA